MYSSGMTPVVNKAKVMVFIAKKVDSQYLLFSRHNTAGSGHGGSRWYVVTGNVEKKESSEQAAKREVTEETGIRDTQNILKLPLKISFLSSTDTNIKFTEQAYLIITNDSGPIVLNEESDDFCWLSLDDFCNTIYWSQDKNILKNILYSSLK